MREETGYGTAEKTGDEREEGQESEQKWGQVMGQTTDRKVDRSSGRRRDRTWERRTGMGTSEGNVTRAAVPGRAAQCLTLPGEPQAPTPSQSTGPRPRVRPAPP